MVPSKCWHPMGGRQLALGEPAPLRQLPRRPVALSHCTRGSGEMPRVKNMLQGFGEPCLSRGDMGQERLQPGECLGMGTQ